MGQSTKDTRKKVAGNAADKAVASGRLAHDAYAQNFCDIHPLYNRKQAMAEADRCYFCHDAPCMAACPSDIDVAMFIRQIKTGNTEGAARTILSQNILGGMCARVCPTEQLCEEACVRGTGEERPVGIARLQRYGVDGLIDSGTSIFTPPPWAGKKVAVVGSGPAGLSCAHALVMRGHHVTIFDARPKLGGLNEYGIAAYKSTNDFAQREVAFVLSIGGIETRCPTRLGRDIALSELRRDFDAVFLGLGLGGANALGLEGENAEGVIDAVDYIATLRQSRDKSTLPVGRRVVVIGGGMSAIDIAVQSKLLGADELTIAYRRGPEQMGASRYERELAQIHGVVLRHWLAPKKLLRENGHLRGIECDVTMLKDGLLTITGKSVILEADVLFKAIGQTFAPDDAFTQGDAITLANGRIKVDEARKTSLPDVWAGGDCIDGGRDLTVVAVQDGKIAARAIDRHLRKQA